MSRILQYSIKLSALKFSRNALSVQNKIARPLFPCLNHVSKYSVSTAPKYAVNLNATIEKLDENVKRSGRLTFKEVENALNEVRISRSITETQSLMMIRCCGSLLPDEPPEKRTKLVENVWKTLQDLGVALDVSHYNALLRVFIENEHEFAPTDILAEMKSKGLEPNRVTCQRLITRYCQAGDIAGATRILQYMREKDMPVNVNVFNALILGHSRANDMDSAESMLAVMKDAGVEPTSETYALLICGYIKQGNLSKVEELFKLCDSQDIVLTNKDYFDIIYAYAVHNYEDEIDKLLSRIRKVYDYNHDAYNFTCKLVLAGKPEIGYKVLKSMNRITRIDGSGVPVGNFFISVMVASEQPVDLILKYCKELMEENLNPQALDVALANSLRMGKESIALALLKETKERGKPIRNHYFWPLLVSRGKKKDVSGLLNILSIMSKEYGINPSQETVREYVMPYLLDESTDIEKILLDLRSCDVSIASAVSSIVVNLLEKHKIKKAAAIAQNFRAYYPMFLVRRPLISSFLATKDIDSFVKILGAIAAGIQRKNTYDQEKAPEEEEHVTDYRQVVGRIVEQVIQKLTYETDAVVLAEKIIQKLFAGGIGISPENAKEIENILEGKLPSHSLVILNKLTSEEFASSPGISGNSKLPLFKMDEETLERLEDSVTARGGSAIGIKRQLLIAYSRDGDMEKVLQVKNELEAENALTEGTYAIVIESLATHDRVDEAMELYRSMCEKNPEFSLNKIKTLRLAFALVDREQYDEALKILTKKVESTELVEGTEENYFTNSLSWRILNSLADKGQVEKVKQFFDILQSGNFMTAQSITVSPLVKAHATRGDWKGALNEFETCVHKYKVTPWKHLLMKHFIEAEDADSLQKITDLSTEIHGERSSLCDLVLAFLECGRVKQSKKILETPGVRLNQFRLSNACEKYVKEGAETHLLNLLELTKEFPYLDRNVIFESLLSVYTGSNDTNKALGLWTQMQDEDVTPTDDFLIRLAALLKKNDIAVPFSVPEKKEAESDISSVPERNNTGSFRREAYESSIKTAILSGDLDKALEVARKKMPKGLNKRDWILLVGECVKNGRYSDAKDLFETYFNSNNLMLSSNNLREFLIAAADACDVELFERLSGKLTEDLKKKVAFNNLWASAYVRSNRTDELISLLEKQLHNANTEKDLEIFVTQFPRGIIAQFCTGKPENFSRVETLIKNAMEKCSESTVLPNILWMLYMCKKDFEKADEIWKKHLNQCDMILFGSIISYIKRTNDGEVFSKLVDLFENRPHTTNGPITSIYASRIYSLVEADDVEEALKQLKEMLTKVNIEDFPRQTLIKLEKACLVRNIPFPYNIPAPKRDSRYDYNTSSSDSD